MYELKKIKPSTQGKAWSFVFGLLYLIFALISLISGKVDLGPSNPVVTIVVGVILFSIVGSLLGIIVALVYNFAAKRWGGVELDFRLVEEDERGAVAHEDAQAQK